MTVKPKGTTDTSDDGIVPGNYTGSDISYIDKDPKKRIKPPKKLDYHGHE